MARWVLLGAVVGLALCVGLPSVALADQAPPAVTASPPPAAPAEPGPAPAQPGYPPPVAPAAAPAPAYPPPPPPAYPPAAYPPPPPGYAPPPAYPAARPTLQVYDRERGRAPAPRQRRKIGLMIVGLAMFGGGYVGSVLSLAASSTLYGEAGAFGPQMLVPIAGPWLQLSSTDWDAVADNQRASAQFTLVLQGALQGVGAVLATVGISQYVASKPPERALSFQLGPTNGGAFGVIRGAF
jgi:hypothetical protein